jgi:hypothetical protein
LARVVSHLAIEYGIHHRRQPLGELITADWIHQRHAVERRTLGAMADEIGVSDSTIGKWARKFGIPVHHWNRRPLLDPRVTRLLEALSIEPGDVPAGMQTAAAWARIQRFAIAGSYDNFTRAAEALGCRKARLSAQIGRLEADLGHTLVERAVSRQHPMTLTSFGEELAQAARRIDGPRPPRRAGRGPPATPRAAARLIIISSGTYAYLLTTATTDAQCNIFHG